MRKITLFFLSLIFVSSTLLSQEKRNCHSMNNLEYRQSLDPSLKQRMDEIESFTQKRVKEMQNLQGKVNGQIITIPVVVHVIYNSAQENISMAQIQSQIDVLNEDFRRTNSDATNKWSQAADTQIEFQLATVDPNGNSTTGVTRKSSSKTSWGTNDAMKKSSQGGVDPWNAGEYLNMWVCNIGGGILGYAQFPGGSASTDGIVMSPQYFGSSDKGSGFYLSAPFDKGRTTTHEIGHFLNLRHIWGDGGCSVDDFVSDTPTSDAANYGCATGHNSCGSEDMVENYMDYSDDSCMNLFTTGQKNRMRAVLEAGGSRRSLALSDKFGGGSTPTCSDGIQNGDETGIDCGGSSCAPCQTSCTDNEATFSLTFDNYASETSWTITNSSGTTVASGSGYGSANNGTTITENLCLPDGCYTFTINDSYGDGICCSYGNGSYSITDSSGSLASGGSFGSSESKQFCVGGSAPPTCSDGIQNGDETGIDCGGSSCAPCDTGGGNTVLHEGTFESGWDGWSDGGSDCFRYSGSRSSEGNYSIRIRDNSGTASAMTSETFNLSSFNQVEVAFEFYAYSMENNEDFWLRYYNGSSWSTLKEWKRGTDFNNNTFYSATVTINASDVNFVNNARFRFQCDASGNADHIYIDKVKITGIGAGARNAGGDTLVALRSLDTHREGGTLEEEFAVYPNPVKGNTLFVKVLEESNADYKIINMLGQVVKKGKLSKQIDVGNLQSGIYLFEINDIDEKITRKFVKK
ncbi:M43 family zinc metalloprotease [uncultured Tenacibaculum sp.]|uniref:M43 family zinc metalloprotease n=1 Tax=uncultured Tenacibaculum sp. TaxID=174713 RepID=UPI0034158FDA